MIERETFLLHLLDLAAELLEEDAVDAAKMVIAKRRLAGEASSTVAIQVKPLPGPTPKLELEDKPKTRAKAAKSTARPTKPARSTNAPEAQTKRGGLLDRIVDWARSLGPGSFTLEEAVAAKLSTRAGTGVALKKLVQRAQLRRVSRGVYGVVS
jgi:hypothetical protein